MKVTFLSASKPLTKTYIFNQDGTIDSQPYPLSSEFTSHEENVESIEDFLAHIISHGDAGRCLLRGNLERSITRGSRAGITAQAPTYWMVLDFDGLDPKGKSIQDLMAELGLGDIDYIIQYSSSQGIKPGLNAHIFFLLSAPHTHQQLKAWVKWKNLTVFVLREQLRLTKSNMSLHWMLDITVNQADKLIYIAPPILSGRDEVLTQRVELVKGTKRSAIIGSAPSNVDIDTINIVKQLRSAAGLPDHSLVTKFSKRDKTDILVDPDRAAVTGVKRNIDFTYLNLNNGDSWGYYFLTAQPELLFNFKGEPVYRLQDICPEYYLEAKTFARQHKQEAHRPNDQINKNQYFVINRKDEGRYYKVTYKPNKGATLDPAPTMKHYTDFCINHKVPVPEIIEDWDIIFDPTSSVTIDVKEKTINVYHPTDYRQINPTGQSIPEFYYQLFTHVCGSDSTATDRLINWIAYIWQTGRKPKTAWVLHGTYGTGKGLVQKILSNLFGDHCVVTSPERIDEKFNSLVEYAQILWVDEVTTDSWDNSKVTPKLRNWITEDFLSVRTMRKDSRTIPSYMGIMIAANEHNPVEIRFGDRRINVAPRQETPILNMPWCTQDMIRDDSGWIYQPENLSDLADALYSYKVDDALVRIPLDNEAKTQVMRVTQNLPEDIVQALLQGNTSFFLEYIVVDHSIPNIEACEYREIVAKMMRGGRMPIATREVAKIFEFLAGWKQSPGKFSKALAKFGLGLSGKTAREGNRTFAGTYFTFNVTDEDRAFWAQYSEPKLEVVRDSRSQ